MNAPDAQSVVAADPFAAARDWFRAQGYTPFAFQEAVWQAYAERRSGLIHAPTGMGKTYAALLGPLLLGAAGAADSPPPLTVLWLTPLRALAQDTGLALARAAAAL
jgi:ATP-dependent helicase Lhr and Lhr-like helicase